VITCRLLGPVAVLQDGEPAPPALLWRKHLALFIYLALSPKRTRTREHLIGLLWSDRDESAARHSLREAVRVLRQAMGPNAVQTEGQQVRLAPDCAAFDVTEFEALASGERWEQAAALVTGDFLEGFSVPDASAFEDWVGAERLEWRHRAATALRGHAARCLADGRTPEAVAAARRAMALEPLSDLAAQTLMRALALHGDRAAALESFTQFARRVRQAAGAEPAEATTAMAERVRRARGPAPPTHAPTTEGLWTRRAPLVGRTDVLARLTDLWEHAAGGRGATVALIEGDLGHGRTRLLDELAHRATLAGGAVASVLAVRSDRDEPWSGVVGLARGGLGDMPGAAAARPEALAAFVAHLPDWADRFPGARGPAAAPGPAFREVVGAAAQEGPVLLSVDEAHCLDDDSLLALQAAMRDLRAARVMLALSVLPGGRHAVLDELRSGLGETWPGAAIRLQRLTNAEVATLAAWALPSFDAAALDRVTRRVALDSAGIPLLVVELLHAVTLGLDPAEAGLWPAPFRTLSQTLPTDLPDAVVGAVRVGFRALSPAAQSALTALAVLPDRAPDALIGRVAQLEPTALGAALDELEWHRWITGESRGYTFVARIVRDIVARDMVTPGQKRRLTELAGLTAT
jgi:DNA-binding SARP family transcriptional activator